MTWTGGREEWLLGKTSSGSLKMGILDTKNIILRRGLQNVLTNILVMNDGTVDVVSGKREKICLMG